MAILVSVNTRDVNATTYRQLLQDRGIPILNEWQEGPVRIFKIPEGYNYPEPGSYRNVSPQQYQAAVTPEEKQRQEDLKKQQEFVQSTIQTGGSTREGYVSDLSAYEQQQKMEEARQNVRMPVAPSQEPEVPMRQGKATKTAYMEPAPPQLEIVTPTFQEQVQARMEGKVLKPLVVTGELVPAFYGPDYETANFGEIPEVKTNNRIERDIAEFGSSVMQTSPPGIVMQVDLGTLGIFENMKNKPVGYSRVESLAYGIKSGIMGFGYQPIDYFLNRIWKQDIDVTAAQLTGMFGIGIIAGAKTGYSKISARTAKVSYSFGAGEGKIFYLEKEPVSFGQMEDIFITVGKGKKAVAYKGNLEAYFLTEQIAAKEFKTFGKSTLSMTEYPDVMKSLVYEKGTDAFGKKYQNLDISYTKKAPAITANAAAVSYSFDVGKAPDVLFRDYQRGKIVSTIGKKTKVNYFASRTGLEKMYSIDFMEPVNVKSFLGGMPAESVAKYNAMTEGLLIGKRRLSVIRNRFQLEGAQFDITGYKAYRVSDSILRGETIEPFARPSGSARDVLYDLKMHYEIDSILKNMESMRQSSIKAATRSARKSYAKQLGPAQSDVMVGISSAIESPFGKTVGRGRHYESETGYVTRMPKMGMELEPELRFMKVRLPLASVGKVSMGAQKSAQKTSQNRVEKQILRQMEIPRSAQLERQTFRQINLLRGLQLERQMFRQMQITRVAQRMRQPTGFLSPRFKSPFGGAFFNITVPKSIFENTKPYKRFASLRYKYKYTPSLIGEYLNLKISKSPKGALSGIEIRPMVALNARPRRRKVSKGRRKRS